jgi:hypothetical protein
MVEIPQNPIQLSSWDKAASRAYLARAYGPKRNDAQASRIATRYEDNLNRAFDWAQHETRLVFIRKFFEEA